MGRFDHYLKLDEEERAAAEAAQQAAEPPPPAPKPAPASTGRETSMAITPEEGIIEKAKNKALEQVEKFDPAAAGYGALRGGTLGASDRLAAAGAWLADKSGLVPGDPDPNAYDDERKRFLAAEEKKRTESPNSYSVGETAGSFVPALAAAPLAGASKAATASEVLTPLMRGKQVLRAIADNPLLVAREAALTPTGQMAAQNFASGFLNERSDDLGKQAQAGLKTMGLGAVVGKVADATIGKALTGAVSREGRGMVQDIMQSESGAMATPTARKQLVQKLAGATQEMRRDPVLMKAIREDSNAAANIVGSKIDVLSEPRPQLYKKLDAKVPQLTLADLHSGLFKAIQSAETDQEKTALTEFASKLDSFWIPKWEREGALKAQLGKPMAVDSAAIRNWVTKAQRGAANTMGQINETEHEAIKKALKGAAEDIWDQHLAKAATVVPDVVKDIRVYDGRVSSLLSMEKVLRQRAVKEVQEQVGAGKRIENAVQAVGWGAGSAYALEHPWQAGVAVAGMEAARLRKPIARYVNDNVLVPLQLAAERGAPWAVFAQQAAQSGIPQSVARTIYDRATQPKPNPTGTSRETSTAVK